MPSETSDISPLVIRIGFPEKLGFLGFFALVGLLGFVPGWEVLRATYAFASLFSLFGVAFFKSSAVNLRMPERLCLLGFGGFLGCLGFLGYLPHCEWLWRSTGFSGLSGFFAFFAFTARKGHRYSLPDDCIRFI